MKNTVKLILSAAMALSLCACSSTSTSTSTTDTTEKTETKENNAYPVSIDDFKWTVDKEAHTFTFENNSDYDLLFFQLAYTCDKDDNELFSNIIDKYGSEDDITDEDEPELANGSSPYLKAGSKSDPQQLQVCFGNVRTRYYIQSELPTDEQFNAMKETYVYVQVVKDDTLYTCIYDLVEDKWDSDKPETEALNEWPDNELTQAIVKPEDCVFQSELNELDALDKTTFYFVVYNVSEDYYNDYIGKLEEKGFEYKGISAATNCPLYMDGTHTLLTQYYSGNKFEVFLTYNAS